MEDTAELLLQLLQSKSDAVAEVSAPAGVPRVHLPVVTILCMACLQSNHMVAGII